MPRASKAKVVVAFLIGGATGPLIVNAVKPHMRSIAKATIKAGIQVKKQVAEAAEDLEDLAAEVAADAAAEVGNNSSDHVTPIK